MEELTASAAVRPDNTVLIDTGVIYFSKPAVATLLTLARTLPLSNCTYLGLDSGLPALRVELYSDIMLAMGYGLGRSFDAYAALPTADLNPDTTLTGRKLMWDALFSTPFHALVVRVCLFLPVPTVSHCPALLDIAIAGGTWPILSRWNNIRVLNCVDAAVTLSSSVWTGGSCVPCTPPRCEQVRVFACYFPPSGNDDKTLLFQQHVCTSDDMVGACW